MQLFHVANGQKGLEIFNITNPNNPRRVGHFDDGGTVNGVYVSASYAYVADETDGLEVLDISDPTNPTLTIGYLYSTTNDRESDHDWSVRTNTIWSSAISDVFVSGAYIYLARMNFGLDILRLGRRLTIAPGFDLAVVIFPLLVSVVLIVRKRWKKNKIIKTDDK